MISLYHLYTERTSTHCREIAYFLISKVIVYLTLLRISLQGNISRGKLSSSVNDKAHLPTVMTMLS